MLPWDPSRAYLTTTGSGAGPTCSVTKAVSFLIPSPGWDHHFIRSDSLQSLEGSISFFFFFFLMTFLLYNISLVSDSVVQTVSMALENELYYHGDNIFAFFIMLLPFSFDEWNKLYNLFN